MLQQIFEGGSVKGRASSQCVDLSEVRAEILFVTLRRLSLTVC